ncbi:hypothetical protein HC928_11630 [bacterium]|nr:hypothetical protein [bacterium]
MTADVEYWLGFLLTDGCVYAPKGRTPRIELRLAACDFEHIEKFRVFFQSTHTITFHRKQNACSVVIPSAHLADRLATFGVVPRKTYIQQSVPECLRTSSDFWRGVIDGDGCIHTTGRRGVSLVSANMFLLDDFVAYVRTIESNNCYGQAFKAEKHGKTAAIVCVQDVLRSSQTLQQLYKSGVSLNRKYLKAKELIDD